MARSSQHDNQIVVVVLDVLEKLIHCDACFMLAFDDRKVLEASDGHLNADANRAINSFWLASPPPQKKDRFQLINVTDRKLRSLIALAWQQLLETLIRVPNINLYFSGHL